MITNTKTKIETETKL